MGCSNDSEKPLNKRNKKIKKSSKPENISNNNKK